MLVRGSPSRSAAASTLPPLDVTAGFSARRFDVPRRQRNRQHDAVGIEPEIRGRLRQHGVESGRAVDAGLGPGQPLHALLGRDPWTAGFAPAGRAEERHLEPESVRFGGRVPDGVVPLGAAKADGALDGLTAAGADVGELEAADADALHPLEIPGDPFMRDVSARPVPPGARLRGIRRRAEPFGKGVSGVLRVSGGERDPERDRGHSGKERLASFDPHRGILAPRRGRVHTLVPR